MAISIVIVNFNGQKWLSTFQNNGNSDPVVTAWIKPLTQYTLGDFRIFDFKWIRMEIFMY